MMEITMRRIDRNSKEWRQLVAWIVGMIVVGIVVYVTHTDNNPSQDIDAAGFLIMGISWAAIVYFFKIYVKENVK